MDKLSDWRIYKASRLVLSQVSQVTVWDMHPTRGFSISLMPLFMYVELSGSI